VDAALAALEAVDGRDTSVEDEVRRPLPNRYGALLLRPSTA
jgi:hypothetical protein